MTRVELCRIANLRVEELVNRLLCKNEHYSPDPNDALANMRSLAELDSCKQTEAAWHALKKHVAHLQKMCKGETVYPLEAWTETLGDICVYCIIIEAIITEEKQ